MLYYLFKFLEEQYDIPGAGLFQYISFRAGTAIILSLIISILLGGRIIRFLQNKQVGETVRDLGLQGQLQKAGTPTMGGIIIILATLVPCLLLARLDNIYIILMIVVTVWMALIGGADDYIKVFLKNKQGLKGRTKIIGQVILGLIVGIVMLYHNGIVVRMDPAEAALRECEVIETVHTVDSRSRSKDVVYVKTTLTNVPFLRAITWTIPPFYPFWGTMPETGFGSCLFPL